MSSLQRWRSLYVFIVVCVTLGNAVTDSGISSTIVTGQTNAEPSVTPAPIGEGTEAVESTVVGTAEAPVTVDSASEAFSVDSTRVDTDSTRVDTTSEAFTTSVVTAEEAVTVDSRAVITLNVSEAPNGTTVPPVVTSEGCLCDLTPDFCDIGCCCDTVDCGVANLSTVFTGCQQKAVLGVCIEKWLMFRANVNSSLVTITDSLFCVQSSEKETQLLAATPTYPDVGDSYHFSPPISANKANRRDFYKVDDVVQTYFSNSSVRRVLYQPHPGSASSFCISHNPARFLRSVSQSCSHMLTPQSCTSNPNLSARSYYFDMSLIKVPKVETEPVFNFLIPVIPVSEWPAPRLQNNICVNVVKKVEFVIDYTSRGELVNAQVNVELADVDPNQLLLQMHSVQFQLAAPNQSLQPVPTVGLREGSPVIGRFNRELTTLSTLGVSQGGQCSSETSRRAPILFAYNTVTGCSFSSPSSDCSELQSQIYGVLRGLAIPDEMAMNSGSQKNWTRVITQDCPTNLQETCESGCILPSSLSIQVLWARQGLLDHPQNYILGAKYLFHCQNVKCPLSSPLILSTEVTFADTTVYPEPPRGSLLLVAMVTWSLILFIVILLYKYFNYSYVLLQIHRFF